MKNETLVFIDNSYLDKISMELGGGKRLNFDINQFAHTISHFQKLWCIKTYLYTAPPYRDDKNPTEDQKRREERYNKFKIYCQRIKNFIIKEGDIKKAKAYKQKGVYAKLKEDLHNLSSSKEVNEIILVSANDHLVQVISELKDNGISTILFYYNSKNSKFYKPNPLIKTCSKSICIEKKYFDKSKLGGVNIENILQWLSHQSLYISIQDIAREFNIEKDTNNKNVQKFYNLIRIIIDSKLIYIHKSSEYLFKDLENKDNDYFCTNVGNIMCTLSGNGIEFLNQIKIKKELKLLNDLIKEFDKKSQESSKILNDSLMNLDNSIKTFDNESRKHSKLLEWLTITLAIIAAISAILTLIQLKVI